MRVMPANQSQAYALADEYGVSLVGHLYSPDGYRRQARLPFALDPGTFPSWAKRRPWDAAAFERLCDKVAASGRSPLWVVVPDVVTDRAATLRLWDAWAPKLARLYGWPLALTDGTGWHSGDPVQTAGLHNYLRRVRDGLGPCPRQESVDLFGLFSYERGTA